MDLIAQAVKHQKELSTGSGSSLAPAAPATNSKPDKSEPSKNAEPQNLADANDILSALGQEPLQQALKNQEIKPEQNMIRIEDITQEPAEKALQKHEMLAPKRTEATPILQ